MSGAKQWCVPCPCIEDRPSRYCMASEVSQNNIGFFPSSSEYRVHSDLDESDVQQYLDRAEREDRPLVACNDCRALLLVGDGVDLVYPGEPRHDGHTVAGGAA